MTRLQPRCPENAHFLDYVRISYLLRCRHTLPKSVLDKSWLAPPAALKEVSNVDQQQLIAFLVPVFNVVMVFTQGCFRLHL